MMQLGVAVGSGWAQGPEAMWRSHKASDVILLSCGVKGVAASAKMAAGREDILNKAARNRPAFDAVRISNRERISEQI
jgi:hypothetical protein